LIHALVFDTDTPSRADAAVPSPIPAGSRLAGLTLLRRAVLMAWRAGACTATVVVAHPDDAPRWSASEMSLPIPVTVLPDAAPLPDWEEEDQVLVLCAQVLAAPALLERLVKDSSAAAGSVTAVVTSAAVSGPAVLAARDLRESGRGRQGLAVTVEPPQEDAPAPRISGTVRQVVRSPRCAVALAGVGDYRHLCTKADIADADRRMYEGLTSITDGYIDRVFNRHISRWFTRRIINLPITPNQVTWLHFSLGLIAAALFWQPHYWQHALGALLFQLSVALDCSDGEVARLKYQFSKFGSWLDVATDNVVTVAVFAAVARTAAARLGLPLAATLGGLSVTGVLMCVGVIFTMATLQKRYRPGEASSLAATNRLSGDSQAVPTQVTLVDRVINEATSRDFSVIVVGCALLGRLEWMAWLAGIGSHVFWMLFAAIQLCMIRTANAQTR
jgi:phosphatidylglycerophosphate synthase